MEWSESSARPGPVSVRGETDCSDGCGARCRSVIGILVQFVIEMRLPFSDWNLCGFLAIGICAGVSLAVHDHWH